MISQAGIDELNDLIAQIYEINGVGGALHIVLDDFNLDDSNIQWCIDNTIPEVKDSVERELYERTAELLLAIDETDRREIVES